MDRNFTRANCPSQGKYRGRKDALEDKEQEKVLEKLENHYAWIMGPDVDEAFFVSRKLQFFQTMRKQYELMNKVKTQRQSMKTSDSTPQVEEDTEKSKEKAAKQVEVTKEAAKRVTKKTKGIKKMVKCRPKSVKNTGGNLMKKIRKAVLL
ncbi:uncharacterized protein LOC114544730 [Dendronephthya gigantea]|uniref:uncharacterized protein LOC114544730 n=1 Tax=Dendronephthya gigantea TaxID=151771 RepID=UPI00106A0012|nr:uncharacterized protein LOC114544730 [Dendronephthya gigantea]